MSGWLDDLNIIQHMAKCLRRICLKIDKRRVDSNSTTLRNVNQERSL